MASVSIIIVNYKTQVLVESCIHSIFQNTTQIDYEIIVVDNNSDDNSLTYLQRILPDHPAIRYIQIDKNIGFAGANNRAARLANSEYMFFLNPDTLLQNNAVKLFYDFLEGAPASICAVGTNLKNQQGIPQISYGCFPSIKEELYKLGYKLIFFSKNKYSSAIAAENFSGEVDYINGADLFVRSSVFHETGGFDERFFLYFEESDWCRRAIFKGYKNFIITGPQIIHLAGESIKQSSLKHKLLIFEKSKLYFFSKHYGKSALYCLKFLNVLNFIKIFLWSFNFVYLNMALKQFFFKLPK